MNSQVSLKRQSVSGAIPIGRRTCRRHSRQDVRWQLSKMIPDIIKNAILIGCGSFIGGAARYLISVTMKTMSKGFPWGTLAVNLVGCLVIGLLWGFFSKNSSESSSWALFMTVGICGGFTTFSTFSKETLMMLQAGNFISLLAYVTISVIAGIALVAAGYYLVRL